MVVLLGASVLAAVIGNALTPLLLRESPVLLLAVQSSYAQMGLASPRVDPVTFVAVAATRRWIGEVIAFAGGRVLGPGVLDWYRRRGGRELPIPEGLQRQRALVRDAVVVLVPHPLLAAFFGMAGMPPRRYVALKLVGSVLTVALFLAVADLVATPLAAAGAFLDANTRVLTIIGVLAVGLWALRERRRPRR